MNGRRLSTQILMLLAIALPMFAVFSTWAGLGCSEGVCGIAATVVAALWLPIIGAWLVVVAILLWRLVQKDR